MTLSSTSVKSLYNGDSSTKAFSTGFIFWNSSELEVILVSSSGNETTWTEGTQYSVTGGGGATGTITASTTPTDYTPASGNQLLIRSALEDIQATSLPAGGVFPSTAVEQELDRIVRRLQEKEEELTRSIKLAVSSTFADLILPVPEASKFIRWNSAATELENADVGDVSAVGLPIPVADGGTGATTAAAARTALGLDIGTDVLAPSGSGASLTGIRTQGLETIWVPRAAMVARTTNGAAAGLSEMSTAKNMVQSLDFDASTQEFAQFSVAFPKSWDEGTVTFRPHWTVASSSASGGVVWALQAVAVSDGDALDVSFGTEQGSSDTMLAFNQEHVGPTSAAITIAGTPAVADRVMFQIKRNVADAGDTIAVDAKLTGTTVFFTTNAADDT